MPFTPLPESTVKVKVLEPGVTPSGDRTTREELELLIVTVSPFGEGAGAFSEPEAMISRFAPTVVVEGGKVKVIPG